MGERAFAGGAVMQVDGAIEGWTTPQFGAVKAAFASLFADGLELGASFALVIDGEPVAELWGGFADRGRTQPFARTTLTPVYSTTKPIAALVVGMLADQGAIDLEAPVADIWPEFGAHGKDKVSIADAMAHKAGVPGFVEPIDPDLWLDPPRLAAAVAALEPLWEPGTKHGYHPQTYGAIVGEIARRASGRSLGGLLRQEVCAPLGIDFWIGTPASEHARCAEILKPRQMTDFGELNRETRAAFLTKWASATRGGAAWREAEMPGVNGHGTALATAMLFQAFASGGRIGPLQLFGPKTYDALTQERARGPDLVLPFDLSLRAGIMGNSNLFYGPNPEALGHSGWGGSCGFADPAQRLSGAYVMNQQSNALMNDPRPGRLIAATYGCL
ncbi:MAG: serine hydrolase domain-containing protein [Caulobacterales bacterium]